MIPIEIVLVIIGILVVVLSYFITEKISDNKTTLGDKNTKKSFEVTTENTDNVRQRINEILYETMNDIVDETEDQLNKISNEKIMAVSDFSDQILEKIDQNHQEVIFLYNMLNEKDNEIKETLKQIESMKSFIRKESLSIHNHEILDESNTTSENSVIVENNLNDMIMNEDNLKDNIEDNSGKMNGSSIDDRLDNEELISQNNNDLILAYHRQGMSIMDIAKNLCLGQGEVKLVIDLFQGERK